MDERSLEDKISMGEPGSAGNEPETAKVPEVKVNFNNLNEEFASEQPFHEEAWEEEAIPLSGEINATDTFITGEQFRDDPFDMLEGPSDLTAVSEDDPFDAYRADDYNVEASLNRSVGDANNEFAGELTPVTVMGTGFVQPRKETQENFEAADNGGIQADAPAGNKTFGWVAIILAIASMFYWPTVLGPAAAVFGVIAYLRGNKALGAWSVVLGLLAVLAFYFLIPYYS